jgi:hypothetical protein
MQLFEVIRFGNCSSAKIPSPGLRPPSPGARGIDCYPFSLWTLWSLKEKCPGGADEGDFGCCKTLTVHYWYKSDVIRVINAFCIRLADAGIRNKLEKASSLLLKI